MAKPEYIGDTLTPAERSERMARVRNTDTKPEMIVRRLVHQLGYRYRLHVRSLPGIPDLVFRSRRKVVFVHGCFWHRHEGCALNRTPKSRLEFWVPKLAGNSNRDAANLAKLNDLGWDSLVIWECEIGDRDGLARKLATFLGPVRL